MKEVNVGIRGSVPLLMHRFDESAELDKPTRKVLVKSRDPRKEAEKAAYRLPDGTLYAPGSWFLAMLQAAGSEHKARGSRRSLRYIIPSAVMMEEEVVPILNGDGKSKAKEFEVDSRPVVIRATKGRIMRHRPKLNHWGADFRLLIDDDVLPLEVVNQLMVEGGQKIGVGDHRPAFGRFIVTKWDAP